MTTIGLLILCMIILFICRKRRVQERSKGRDSDYITMLAPEAEMVESSMGHGTRDSGHSTDELAGRAPMEHARDNKGLIPRFKPLALIRELGFENRGNEVPMVVKLQVPSRLPDSLHPPPSPRRRVRGSYQPSIDSFYGAA